MNGTPRLTNAAAAKHIYRIMSGAHEAHVPCPSCRQGRVLDHSDPLAPHDTHAAYKCNNCGLIAERTRKMSEELRTAHALRYSCSGEAPLPEPEYKVIFP